MSFMRGEWYIYPSDAGVVIQHHTGSVVLPDDIAEDLAAMIWHKLDEPKRQAVLERVAQNYAGNGGADGVLRLLGRPTMMDMVDEALKAEGLPGLTP